MIDGATPCNSCGSTHSGACTAPTVTGYWWRYDGKILTKDRYDAKVMEYVFEKAREAAHRALYPDRHHDDYDW